MSLGTGSEIRDPEKNLFRISEPGPGVKKAPNTGSGSATLLFTPQKLSLSSQKYKLEIRDPESGKNLFRIIDPGVKKAQDLGSGSPTWQKSRVADPDPNPDPHVFGPPGSALGCLKKQKFWVRKFFQFCFVPRVPL